MSEGIKVEHSIEDFVITAPAKYVDNANDYIAACMRELGYNLDTETNLGMIFFREEDEESGLCFQVLGKESLGIGVYEIMPPGGKKPFSKTEAHYEDFVCDKMHVFYFNSPREFVDGLEAFLHQIDDLREEADQ